MPELDELIALEYGRVAEGVRGDRWHAVSDRVAYLRDGERGRAVGFTVRELSQLDVDDAGVADVWRPPRFDVPMLGLDGATAGEVILASRAFFAGRPSVGYYLLTRAAEAHGEEALDLWLAAIEAGEVLAHYGAGRAFFRLGRYREAYRHLRYSASLSPELTWSWYAYGRAAQALGLDGEACDAYDRAVALEDGGGEETGARELLAQMRARRPKRRARRRGC
jgi:tetratricopeptide (TPR) repeat protein